MKLSLLIATLLVVQSVNTLNVSCQPTLVVGINSNAAITLVGVAAEYNVYEGSPTGYLSALHVGASVGIPVMVNARLIPVDFHAVLFPGDYHLDIAIGVFFMAKWWARETPSGHHVVPDETNWRSHPAIIPNNFVNPLISMAYYYLPKDGGFCFKLGLGAMYVPGQQRFAPFISSIFGYAW